LDALLLYDGVCGLCDRFVRSVLRADSRKVLRYAPLQGPTAAPILKRHGLDAAPLGSVVLVLDAGGASERALVKSDAALGVWGLLGGARRALHWPLRAVPRPARDFVYDFIAKRRYRWFGRYDRCPAPPPEWKERFLP
jgi:predicted DCC family thiol-disulfide oxidoreductase YuxK